MKIKLLLALIVCMNYLYGCPTCVGNVHHNSPLFFSDELYDIDDEPFLDLKQTGTNF